MTYPDAEKFARHLLARSSFNLDTAIRKANTNKEMWFHDKEHTFQTRSYWVSVWCLTKSKIEEARQCL